MTLATNNEWNYSQLSNPELLWFFADPLTSPDPYNGGVADGAAAVAQSAAATIGAWQLPMSILD